VDRFYNVDCLRPVIRIAAGKQPGFWRKLLCDFPSLKSLEPLRALEPRFVFLDRFFEQKGAVDARHALHYAWMRKGLSARRGICRAEPVKGGIPPDAVLIEGDPGIPVARAYRIEAGKTYVFAYSAGSGHGRVGAVYKLP
jgi:hypothetical protein